LSLFGTSWLSRHVSPGGKRSNTVAFLNPARRQQLTNNVHVYSNRFTSAKSTTSPKQNIAKKRVPSPDTPHYCNEPNWYGDHCLRQSQPREFGHGCLWSGGELPIRCQFKSHAVEPKWSNKRDVPIRCHRTEWCNGPEELTCRTPSDSLVRGNSICLIIMMLR
jgi:hypothetical protein